MNLNQLKKTSRLFFLLALGWALPIWGGEISEYSVKAAYLFNFAKFIQWPAKIFKEEKTPLVIGVLGDDPFGGDLDKVVEGKVINGHFIEIRRFDNFNSEQVSELRRCQILFIAYSEKDRLKAILGFLKDSSVLTVSEIEKFAILGGCVYFDQVGKKVKLVINQTAASKAGLVISAKLLQVSRVYHSEKQP